MRVHVVSDVHGNAEALARAGDGADALLVLGDLVDFVDYHRPERGILGRVLGREASARFGHLRAHGRPGELGAFVREAWSRVPDPPAVVADAVRDQYAELFGALSGGPPVWAIPGNVDLPAVWPEFVGNGTAVTGGAVAGGGGAGGGITAADATVTEIGGLRFGFVGGVPLPPGVEPFRGGPWQPYLRVHEEYEAAVRALGPVDVLCSHTPPAVPELAYDVVTRRAEASSPALRERLRTDRPRVAMFGHVHQPLAARMRVGATECVNVGHFQRTGTPYVLRW